MPKFLNSSFCQCFFAYRFHNLPLVKPSSDLVCTSSVAFSMLSRLLGETSKQTVPAEQEDSKDEDSQPANACSSAEVLPKRSSSAEVVPRRLMSLKTSFFASLPSFQTRGKAELGFVRVSPAAKPFLQLSSACSQCELKLSVPPSSAAIIPSDNPLDRKAIVGTQDGKLHVLKCHMADSGSVGSIAEISCFPAHVSGKSQCPVSSISVCKRGDGSILVLSTSSGESIARLWRIDSESCGVFWAEIPADVYISRDRKEAEAPPVCFGSSSSTVYTCNAGTRHVSAWFIHESDSKPPFSSECVGYYYLGRDFRPNFALASLQGEALVVGGSGMGALKLIKFGGDEVQINTGHITSKQGKSGESVALCAMTWVPDVARQILVNCSDGSVRLLQIDETWQDVSVLHKYKGHLFSKVSVPFPLGMSVACASADGTIAFWPTKEEETPLINPKLAFWNKLDTPTTFTCEFCLSVEKPETLAAFIPLSIRSSVLVPAVPDSPPSIKGSWLVVGSEGVVRGLRELGDARQEMIQLNDVLERVGCL